MTEANGTILAVRVGLLPNRMSALPLKADMCGATRDVRFVPKADMASENLFNYFAITGRGPRGSLALSSIFAACRHVSNST